MTALEWSTPRIWQSKRLTKLVRKTKPRDLSEKIATELSAQYRRESADPKIRAAGRLRPTVCDACKLPSKRTLHFDHSHTTGAFRGWLCSGCNSALGMAKDNPDTLRRLANYLEKSR